MDKYSVLMTVYEKDKPEYFALALNSMIQQIYPPDEIICVKDGPITDTLQKIIDGSKADGTQIVQVQLPSNVGLGLALNEGLKVAKNDLIARMDADDYSMPERCELQIKEFEKDPELDIVGSTVLEFVGSPDHVVSERKVPLTNEEIYRFARRRDPFNHPTVMYKKSAVMQAGGYADYRKNQDSDLWIRMLSNHVKCMNLDEPIFKFRFDEETFKKRKTWYNTKTLISIRHKAWRSGFSSFFDFLIVLAGQFGVFLLPVGFQKYLYKKILRNEIE